MDVPNVIASSNLYAQLARDPELLGAALSLRLIAGRLAETISRTVPTFTDHTIRHMDALWTVAGRVLTGSETTALSSGEAFLLASGFYLHDIGMAYAATQEGLDRVRSSSAYASLIATVPTALRTDAGAGLPCGLRKRLWAPDNP